MCASILTVKTTHTHIPIAVRQGLPRTASAGLLPNWVRLLVAAASGVAAVASSCHRLGASGQAAWRLELSAELSGGGHHVGEGGQGLWPAAGLEATVGVAPDAVGTAAQDAGAHE